MKRSLKISIVAMILKRNPSPAKAWSKELRLSTMSNNLVRNIIFKIKVLIRIKVKSIFTSTNLWSRKLLISGKMSIICNIRVWSIGKIKFKGKVQKSAAKIISTLSTNRCRWGLRPDMDLDITMDLLLKSEHRMPPQINTVSPNFLICRTCRICRICLFKCPCNFLPTPQLPTINLTTPTPTTTTINLSQPFENREKESRPLKNNFLRNRKKLLL